MFDTKTSKLTKVRNLSSPRISYANHLPLKWALWLLASERQPEARALTPDIQHGLPSCILTTLMNAFWEMHVGGGGAPLHAYCLQVSWACIFREVSPRVLGLIAALLNTHPITSQPQNSVEIGEKGAPSFQRFTATCWTPAVTQLLP